MIVSLEEVKDWLRIDGTDDDTILDMIMPVAQERVENFGTSAISSQQAKLMFLVLVTDMYENRNVAISKEVEESLFGTKNVLRYQFGSD